MMENPRKYGEPPFRIAVVHGGPGAGGEMAPVARELGRRRGVLEPIQTATTLQGQVEELRVILKEYGNSLVTLIGYSWGAWLSCLLAAAYPAIVERLVLVSSGPFEEGYVAKLDQARTNRLSVLERVEFQSILQNLKDPSTTGKDASLSRLGVLCSKTDTFDPIPWDNRGSDEIPCDSRLFNRVWQEAADLRRNGELLKLVRQVRCPVVAIHGDHDPHPVEGVEKPLSSALRHFRFVLLERCGHTPWLERYAKAKFFDTLEDVLNSEIGPA